MGVAFRLQHRRTASYRALRVACMLGRKSDSILTSFLSRGCSTTPYFGKRGFTTLPVRWEPISTRTSSGNSAMPPNRLPGL